MSEIQCPEAILAAIPWYPEALTLEERGAVEAHAADCQACRAELAFLRGDEEPAFDLPDPDRLYGCVLERIRAHEEVEDRPAERVEPSGPDRVVPALATMRRVRERIVQPVGIAAGLLVAVVSGMLTVGVIWVARDAPTYGIAVSAPAVDAGGTEIEIVFQSDATAKEISTGLIESNASLTAGPDPLGVYRARLAPGADVDAVLDQLRAAGHGVATYAKPGAR